MRPQIGPWLLIGFGLIVGVLFLIYLAMGRNYFNRLIPLTFMWIVLCFLYDKFSQRKR